jgi:hypothetical protein
MRVLITIPVGYAQRDARGFGGHDVGRGQRQAENMVAKQIIVCCGLYCWRP